MVKVVTEAGLEEGILIFLCIVGVRVEPTESRSIELVSGVSLASCVVGLEELQLYLCMVNCTAASASCPEVSTT